MITEANLKNYKINTGNYFEVLLSKKDVDDNWAFLLEALENVNDPRRADAKMEVRDYLRTMLQCATNWPDSFLGVLKSKNGKPLGMLCAYNSTNTLSSDKILWIYITYSTSRYKGTISEMLTFMESFAKCFKFTKLQAASARISGAAFYWYEKKLKFRRRYIIFEKEMTS